MNLFIFTFIITVPSMIKCGCPSLTSLLNEMRLADVDQASSNDIVLNWGNPINGIIDTSPEPLFTSVSSSLLDRPIYRTLYQLYQYYSPDVCSNDVNADATVRRQFFDLVVNSRVFQLAFDYLRCNEIIGNNVNLFKPALYYLWFDQYSRCKNGVNGSSGFEHVFMGEFSSGSPSGLHNWYRFYRLEQTNEINYFGYFSHHKDLIGSFAFQWNKQPKPISSFLIGTSPAFDMALFTICALMQPGNSTCQFAIDAYPIAVTSYIQPQQCTNGICLSTAYPVVLEEGGESSSTTSFILIGGHLNLFTIMCIAFAHLNYFVN